VAGGALDPTRTPVMIVLSSSTMDMHAGFAIGTRYRLGWLVVPSWMSSIFPLAAPHT